MRKKFTKNNLGKITKTSLIKEVIHAWNCHEEDIFCIQAIKECRPDRIDFLKDVISFLNEKDCYKAPKHEIINELCIELDKKHSDVDDILDKYPEYKNFLNKIIDFVYTKELKKKLKLYNGHDNGSCTIYFNDREEFEEWLASEEGKEDMLESRSKEWELTEVYFYDIN